MPPTTLVSLSFVMQLFTVLLVSVTRAQFVCDGRISEDIETPISWNCGGSKIDRKTELQCNQGHKQRIFCARGAKRDDNGNWTLDAEGRYLVQGVKDMNSCTRNVSGDHAVLRCTMENCNDKTTLIDVLHGCGIMGIKCGSENYHLTRDEEKSGKKLACQFNLTYEDSSGWHILPNSTLKYTVDASTTMDYDCTKHGNDAAITCMKDDCDSAITADEMHKMYCPIYDTTTNAEPSSTFEVSLGVILGIAGGGLLLLLLIGGAITMWICKKKKKRTTVKPSMVVAKPVAPVPPSSLPPPPPAAKPPPVEKKEEAKAKPTPAVPPKKTKAKTPPPAAPSPSFGASLKSVKEPSKKEKKRLLGISTEDSWSSANTPPSTRVEQEYAHEHLVNIDDVMAREDLGKWIDGQLASDTNSEVTVEEVTELEREPCVDLARNEIYLINNIPDML